MKSEEEKKSRHVRIRMTQNQYKQVKEKADEKNLKFSAYVVEAVVCEDNRITPPVINDLRQDFKDAADALESVDPKLAERLRRRGDSLWQLL